MPSIEINFTPNFSFSTSKLSKNLISKDAETRSASVTASRIAGGKSHKDQYYCSF
jgi:hypothetical protein